MRGQGKTQSINLSDLVLKDSHQLVCDRRHTRCCLSCCVRLDPGFQPQVDCCTVYRHYAQMETKRRQEAIKSHLSDAYSAAIAAACCVTSEESRHAVELLLSKQSGSQSRETPDAKDNGKDCPPPADNAW